jgi:aminoglycoside/choline kinase family phosphotransferase
VRDVTAPTFVDIAGSGWARHEPLAGDASSRRYLRVWDRDGRTAIVVCYPPEPAGALARDVEVADWLAGIGLRLPEIRDIDLDRGWAVMEDLGPADAEVTLRSAGSGDRSRLMAALLRPLVLLAARRPEELPGWNRPLDEVRLRWELSGFELWFVRHRRGVVPGDALGRWLDDLAAEVARHPRRVCHRDYHLNNLFVLGSGEVAVIDAQDVLVGPDTYDGVSLLEERAMRELLTEPERRRWRRLWAEQTGASEGWQQRWNAVRIQRALKVLGTFARLEAAGRSGYGAWLSQVAAALAADSDALRLPAAVTALLLD